MVNLANLNPSLNHPHWCKLYISPKRQNLIFLLMFPLSKVHFPSKVRVSTWSIFLPMHWPLLEHNFYKSCTYFIFKGHTRLVNFFNVDSKFYLVDLPGYGYVEGLGSERGTNHFVKVAERYLQQRAGKEWVCWIYKNCWELESKLMCGSGLPWSRKSQGKTKIFQGQGKVRKFFKKSGKIFDIVKVGEKSGNSVFQFVVHKFSSRLWDAFSFLKDEKYAAKQAKQSIWHSTLTHVVVVVSGFRYECFLPNSFFLFPLFTERHWK